MNIGAWSTVYDYRIKEKFDVLKNMANGMYSSEITFVDPEKRIANTNRYYYQKDAKKYNHVPNKYLLTSSQSDLLHNEQLEAPRTVKGMMTFHIGMNLLVILQFIMNPIYSKKNEHGRSNAGIDFGA